MSQNRPAPGASEKQPRKKSRLVAPIPWLAAFLSILMPGLGHVYSHRWFRGVLFFLFSTGFTVLGLVSAWAGFAGMTFLSTAGTFFYLFGIVDAYRCSKKTRGEISILPTDKWSIALFSIAMVVFLGSFALVVAGTLAVKYIGQPVGVETRSMVPTIKPGEKVLANRQISHAYCFRRGDLVAVLIPGYKRVEEIRRVIGLPGEKVAMMAGLVQVDGRTLEEGYAGYQNRPFTYGPSDRAVYFPEVIVPDGSLFLLSDLRDAGEDSREWGPLEESRILGRVDFLFYPLERRRQFADSYLAAMTRRVIGFLPGIKDQDEGRCLREWNLKEDGR
ncbi:MAG: signal peptidase I [Proteobacteria bacterium]|nr:signal peptidase I [Pseudomonadota bacterium]